MKTKLFTLCLVIIGFSASALNDTIVVAQDGTGSYKTIQEAFDAIPVNRADDNYFVIYIKPGIYKEKLLLDYYKDYVVIVGENPINTIISWDDYSGKIVNGDTIRTSSSYTFKILCNDVILKNITVENTAGQVGQAVAVMTDGDRIAFYNCRMLGNQDTFYSHGHISRLYLNHCLITGTTDFIFGSSIAIFDHCDIYCIADSYITAASTTEHNQYGYVFRNCTVKAAPSVTNLYLGRPWRNFAKTVFLECEFDAPIVSEGWNHWVPERELTAFYAEYKCTGKGSNTANRVKWSHQLTNDEASQYTMKNIFAKGTVSEPFKQDWMPE